MEEFIQRLTHDNQLFENQWQITSVQLHTLFKQCKEKHTDIVNVKVTALDALIDYVLTESTNGSQPIDVKFTFIDFVVELFVDDPLPTLTDLVRIFRRILDANNIFNKWHLACIEAFHNKFRLGERLLSTQSIDLIELIFRSLQKHSFLNEQTDNQTQERWQQFLSRRMFSLFPDKANALNHEKLMLFIRTAYQELFK